MKFTLGSVVIVYSHDAVYRHTSIDIETTIYKVFFFKFSFFISWKCSWDNMNYKFRLYGIAGFSHGVYEFYAFLGSYVSSQESEDLNLYF